MRAYLYVFVLAVAAGLAGCGDSGHAVGGSCGAGGDCADGLRCDTTIPGGYCTKDCTTAGSTDECPEGAVCDEVTGAQVYCVQICQTSADCPDTLDCNGVSSSNLKACKPKGDAVDAGIQ
jgi:hypothetical protein